MAISFVGSVAGSTANGQTFSMTLPTAAENDFVIVAYSVPRAVPMRVTSSNPTVEYTQILATTTNGNLNFSVWIRKMPADVETTARCEGTTSAQDGEAAVAFVMRGVRVAEPLDVTVNSTIGTSTTPDSPSVTVTASNDAVLSLVGSLVADNTVTAPTSFVNATSTSATDTRSVTTAGAWITLASTAAFNPGSWTNFTSAAWVSATVALRAASTDPWQDLTGPTNRPDWRKVYVEGY